MAIHGKCKALRVYLDEDLKVGRKLLYRVLVEEFLKAGLAGTTVFKGIEGFGSSARIHSARILDLIENLPVMIEAVDKAPKVLKALNRIEPLLPTHCLVTVQDVKVLHYYWPGKKHRRTKKLS